MSAKKIKRAIKKTDNAFLFETPLAVLQHWIRDHEQLDSNSVPHLFNAWQQIAGQHSTGEVAIVASIFLAEYLAEVGEEKLANKCVRGYDDGTYTAITQVFVSKNDGQNSTATVN